MADKTQPKIGEIRLNDKQKEAIAEFVESDMFKLIKNVVRPKRQIKIGQTGIRTAITDKDLWYYKGMMYESDWLVGELEKIAKAYNAGQDAQDTQE